MYNMENPLEILDNLINSDDSLSDRTKESYQCSVKQFLKFKPKTKISEYQKNDIREWIAHLVDLGYKASTRGVRLVAVKWYFNCSAEDGYIDTNPSFGIVRSKVDEHLPKAIDAYSKFKLREATKHILRDRAIIETLLVTGMRSTELINLRREHIKIFERTIFIEKGKGLRSRYVYFNDLCAIYLQQYLDTHDNDYVFINSRNKPLTRQGLWAIVKGYVTKVGLDDNISTHCMRHTFITDILEKGMPFHGAQKLAGHKNPKTTKIYGQISNRMRKIKYDQYI